MNLIPPQNIELEESILGALMIDSGSIDTAAEELKPEDFYHPSNRFIYSAILNLYKSNQPIDLLTVVQELRESGNIENSGGIARIGKLIQNINSAANLTGHIRVIRELAIKRHLIGLGAKIMDEGYKDTTDALELLKTAENGIFELSIKKQSKKERKVSDLYFELVQSFETKKKGEFEGYKSGFRELDRITLGFEKSNLIILAARPGMGKSALALNFAINLSEVPVAFFSLEMSDKELTQRYGSIISQVPLQFIKTNEVYGKMFTKAFDSIQVANKQKIYIDDTGGLSLLEIRARIKRMVVSYGIEFVIIDYLQKIKPEIKGRSRENEINEISSGLKDIAKEFNVPVLALSQLSRNVEMRADKRPMLSDLRESGSIEQEADKVLFVYRDKYYNPESSDESEIIVSKNRQGGLGIANLNYNADFTKFEEIQNYPTFF